MSEKTPALILDLDGTLRDTSSIAHLLDERPKDYAKFTVASHTCPPLQRVISAIRFGYRGWHLLMFTGQKEMYRAQNIDWLEKHFGPVNWMAMRQNDDNRPAPLVKAEMVVRAQAYGYNPLEAWDDDPDVVRMYNEHDLDVHWVWNSSRVS